MPGSSSRTAGAFIWPPLSDEQFVGNSEGSQILAVGSAQSSSQERRNALLTAVNRRSWRCARGAGSAAQDVAALAVLLFVDLTPSEPVVEHIDGIRTAPSTPVSRVRGR